jgi:transposase-like protein
LEQVEKETHMMTDDMKSYKKLSKSFDKHDVVRHSKKEYVRGKIHTNTIEGFFSILKRGLNGIYQHVWSHHLKRYVAEFDFRYSHRKVSDIERFNIALKRTEGVRLTYYSVTS